MGFFDSIFGDKSKTNQSGTSQTAETGTSSSTAESSMQQFNSIMERIIGSGTSTTTKGGEEVNPMLDQILGILNKGFGGDAAALGKEQAKNASQAAIDAVLKSGLPDVRTANTMSGGYNSTTRQLMADNVFAQAAREGASVELASIQAQQGQQLEAVGQALAALRGMQEGTTIVKTEDEQGRESAEDTNQVQKQTQEVVSEATSETEEEGTVSQRGTSSIFGQVGSFIGNVGKLGGGV